MLPYCIANAAIAGHHFLSVGIEAGAILASLFGGQLKRRVWSKTYDTLDHLRILKFGRNSHFPICDGLLGRYVAKLHERRSSNRARGVNPVPAMNKHGLTFALDGVIDVLMNGRSPLPLPALIDVIQRSF